MAKHYIRDSKGRVEHVLNDKEYAEYNKRKGCIGIIVGTIIIIGLVFGNINDKDVPSKEKSEVQSKSHQENVKTNDEVIIPQEISIQDDIATNQTDDTSEEYEEEIASEEVVEEHPISNDEETSLIDEEELVRRFSEE